MSEPFSPAPRPAFSIPSILAAIAAFCSFRVGAFGGLFLAIIAIVLGVFGMILAVLPARRGGIVSVISIFAGLIGIITAIFKLIAGHW